MAATPEYKLYRDGEYVAACKYLEDSAALVSVLASGGHSQAEIRWGHSVVLWREGLEDQPAGESYDHVRDLCLQRRQQHQVKVYEKHYGPGSATDVAP